MEQNSNMNSNSKGGSSRFSPLLMLAKGSRSRSGRCCNSEAQFGASRKGEKRKVKNNITPKLLVETGCRLFQRKETQSNARACACAFRGLICVYQRSSNIVKSFSECAIRRISGVSMFLFSNCAASVLRLQNSTQSQICKD